MKLLRLSPHTIKQPPCALAIGNFDGVHLGHQALIKETIQIAEKHGIASAALTFEPHPLRLLRPDITIYNISRFRQKVQALQQLGLDTLYIARFNQTLLKTPAEDFIKNTILQTIHAKYVITGENFVFGYKRSGNAALLSECAKTLGFSYTDFKLVGNQAGRFSSSLIRESLSLGKIEKARTILGHDVMLEGRVRRGEGRGKTIGYPTANIALKNYVRPRFGVYAVEVRVEGSTTWLAAIANVGKKPTLGIFKEAIEVHIFDYDADIYGKRLEIALKTFIRDEQKFSSVDELRAQISKDTENVRNWFREHT